MKKNCFCFVLGLMGQNLEVPDLCRMLLGKWAEVIAKVFSLVVLIGANIVYWILMSNFLYNSVLFLYSKLGCLFSAFELENQWFFVAYLSAGMHESRDENSSVICPRDFQHNESISNTPPSHFHQIWDLYTTVPVVLGVIMFPLLNFKSATFFTKFNSLGWIFLQKKIFCFTFFCFQAPSV